MRPCVTVGIRSLHTTSCDVSYIALCRFVWLLWIIKCHVALYYACTFWQYMYVIYTYNVQHLPIHQCWLLFVFFFFKTKEKLIKRIKFINIIIVCSHCSSRLNSTILTVLERAIASSSIFPRWPPNMVQTGCSMTCMQCVSICRRTSKIRGQG